MAIDAQFDYNWDMVGGTFVHSSPAELSAGKRNVEHTGLDVLDVCRPAEACGRPRSCHISMRAGMWRCRIVGWAA